LSLLGANDNKGGGTKQLSRVTVNKGGEAKELLVVNTKLDVASEQLLYEGGIGPCFHIFAGMNLRKFVFNPFQENTYVIWDEEKNCAIIDPGCSDEHERMELTNFIEKEGLNPVKLLNTHCHIDHVLGNRFMAEKYNLGLEMHKLDLPVLNAVPNYGATFGFDTGPMIQPSTFLEAGQVIHVGDIDLKIIHVPGHSPGSICFYHEASKQVISGDALFYGSIGRTDLPGGNHHQLIAAIKDRLFTLPNDVKVHSGHGPATTIGFEKAHNPFLQ